MCSAVQLTSLSNQRELGPCTDLSCLQLAVWPSFWLALWALGVVPGFTALLRLGQTQLAHLYCLKPHLVLQVCDEGPRDFRHEMGGVNCPSATRLSCADREAVTRVLTDRLGSWGAPGQQREQDITWPFLLRANGLLRRHRTFPQMVSYSLSTPIRALLISGEAASLATGEMYSSLPGNWL